MSERHLKLYKPNEGPISIQTYLFTFNEVRTALPILLRQSKVSLAGGFWIDLGYNTHAFVAREPRGDQNCLMEVFAVEVGEDGKVRQDEVFNSALSIFPHAFNTENASDLMVDYYPGSKSTDGDSYPSGTIFTIGSPDPASYPSPDSSNMRCSSRLFEDTYNYPTPAENSDHYDNCSTRKGKVHEEPVSQVMQELNPFANNAGGFTGNQPVNQLLIAANHPGKGIDLVGQSTKASSTADVVMRPETSLSAENNEQLMQDAPKTGSKMCSNDAIMVTGVTATRPDVPADALTVPQAPKRRLSLQVNPVNLPIPEGRFRARAHSDLNNTEGICRPKARVVATHSAEEKQDNLESSPAEPIRQLLRSTSGPPGTPVLDSQRPLGNEPPCPGVERQESRGEDEIVVGSWKKIPERCPSMPGPNIAVTISDTTQAKELQESFKRLHLEDQGLPVIQVSEASKHADAAILPGSVTGLSSGNRSSTTGGSSRSWISEKLSETDLYQVHLLGHACNDMCTSKVGCPHANDPNFTEGVGQMSSLVQRLINHNESSEDLKRYIYIHCDRDCPGRGCKVPHLAAGCPPPSDPHIVSANPSSPLSRHGHCMEVSFDEVAAFDSTTRPPSHSPDGVRTPPLYENQAPPPKDQMKLPLAHPQVRRAPYCPTPTPNRDMPYPGKYFLAIESPFYSSKTGAGSPHPDGQKSAIEHLNSPFGVSRLTSGPGQRSHIYHRTHKEQLSNVNELEQPDKPDKLVISNQQKVHQVSNKECGKGEKTYQYLRSNPNSAAMIRHQQAGRQQLPDVCKEGFPEFRDYASVEPWTVIYSSQDCEDVLTSGFTLPRPYMDQESLGKGGNGKVSRHYVQNRVFAVKETNYRRGELNAWRKLSHPNLVPLLGVMLGRNSLSCLTCYQFMPFMSENLSEVMRRVGSLERLSKCETAYDLSLVCRNMWHHILPPVLQGLQHLESLNMQHCDVKASNVLISKPDTCHCKDILHCKCPDDKKFQVMLADFDSIRETHHRREAQNIPVLKCACKTPDQLKKVMGTVAYRAPEKFVKPCESPPPSLESLNLEHSSMTYLEGPWCDIWSFGMMVVRLALGRDTDADKKNANILRDVYHRKDLSADNEAVHAMLKLKALYKAATENAALKPFADLVDDCLQPDFRLRFTPGQLLKRMQNVAL